MFFFLFSGQDLPLQKMFDFQVSMTGSYSDNIMQHLSSQEAEKNCENSLRCEFVEERVQEKRRIREDAADAADAAAAADAADAEWEGMPEISL